MPKELRKTLAMNETHTTMHRQIPCILEKKWSAQILITSTQLIQIHLTITIFCVVRIGCNFSLIIKQN